MRFIPLVSCLAIACAAPDLEGACKNFVQAANGCNRDYAKEQGIDPVEIDDKVCETDTSGTSDDRYDCKAEAYASADCRIEEAYKEAMADDAACD
jgi:uncharacterized protein YecT (DUF1311 family)